MERVSDFTKLLESEGEDHTEKALEIMNLIRPRKIEESLRERGIECDGALINGTKMIFGFKEDGERAGAFVTVYYAQGFLRCGHAKPETLTSIDQVHRRVAEVYEGLLARKKGK